MGKVVILIIDKSEIFRAGIRQQLSSQQDFRLLDCDPSQEPLHLIEANSVDVALIDIDFPISKGLELGREIARHYPNTRVIIISSYFNDEELFETIKIGAVAYMDKRASIEEFIFTITRASQSDYVINDSLTARPAVAKRILKQFQEMASMGFAIEKVAAPLTHREIQILSFIANGNTNKEVARILGISNQTIKNHVSAILRKLNANDRAHAVAMAIQNHWIMVTEKEQESIVN